MGCLREELSMCRGGRLLADFVAGTDVEPNLADPLREHLTQTVDGLWVVWAHKMARQAGELFIPLTRGPGYPADARAECRSRGIPGARGTHDAPDPACGCGFHALSNPRLPGLPRRGGFLHLTVALSGRVLALEWADSGAGVLWRAERQTVVRVEQAAPHDWTDEFPGGHRHPDDPDGRTAVVTGPAPRDSGPVRLRLPSSAPRLVVGDDAGWCAGDRTAESSPADLVLA
jgi:hypothetical protein